jgi:2-polyprenyl-3-methyl-5-hydroxy-6-metoxy-1,4-benzoquinol methylase
LKEYYNRVYARVHLDLDEKGNTFSKVSDLWRETKPEMRILDLGCGAGSVSNELVRRGHAVYGLDIMQEAVDRAKERGIHAQVYDMNHVPLPFQDGFFDCILALDILEHLFDPMTLLLEMKRLLSKEGYAIVFLPLHFDIRQRLRILSGKGILLYEHIWYDPESVSWEYFHIRFFTLSEAENFIKVGGFVIQQRSYRSIIAADMGPLGRRLLNASVAALLARRVPTLFASGIKVSIRSSD